MNFGFLINNETCIGCHACSTACKSENDVPLGVNRTWVKSVETGVFPSVTRHFQVTRCNHCEKPPCVDICPVTAMYRRDDGIVEFDPELCIGCKACLQACPYDAIYIDPESGTAAKCHYCAHRLDVGLEPACVVVCPEHAILAGDLENPQTEISRTIARNKVSVRKPEQGTQPNVFYVGGEDSALHPAHTLEPPQTFAWADSLSSPAGDGAPTTSPHNSTRFAEQMVQVAYNAQHKAPWHWPVPAYLVTKAVSTGVFILASIALGFGLLNVPVASLLASALVSLVFLAATTALLVYDLERPERFLSILTRPQWNSWLTRGAFVLIAFSAFVLAWVGVEWMALSDPYADNPARIGVLLAGLPLAAAAAAYTAFLFGQAEGRDLWQSPLLPLHLLVQSLMAGAAAVVVIFAFTSPPESVVHAALDFLIWMVLLDLLVILVGEFGMRHASDTAAAAAREVTRGRFRWHFRVGGLLIGHFAPLVLLMLGGVWSVFGASAVIVGLYYYEYAFVMAPQVIPNS